MKVTDYIARFLEKEQVSCVFEMSGGMITHLLDSLHQRGTMRVVSTHHEQTAAFAAEAVGRMTGIPGVALATSGPGATNLLTGIGSCYFDSSPAVFITGQVNRHEQKKDRAIRQLGFQETDIVAMAIPITKAAWMIERGEDVPMMLRRAFDLAVSGRPGPVLLDIPMDVQRENIDADALEAKLRAEPAAPKTDLKALEADAKQLFELLKSSERPLILAGGGVRSARVAELLTEFAHAIQTPVVGSLMGLDALPYEDSLRVGWIGSYGNRWANLAIGRADLLIVLGSRLDVRQTGSETKAFKGERTIFHVDVESGEMNNRVAADYAVTAELPDFLNVALQSARDGHFEEPTEWLAELTQLRQDWPDTKELDVTGINPNVFMHQLSHYARAASAFVTDVGQHQMWAAQSLEVGEGQRFLTSGGMGSMGFGLPAAIGAAFATPGRPVVLVAGDGGFQSNIQELETVKRNNLPVKIVIINNNCHGMVRQFQESYFEGRYQSTLWGYSAPDFARVAEAYGVAGRTVTHIDAMDEALQWFWADPLQPALLQVMVETETNTYPKIAFGRPITEMEPFAKPIEMEST